MARSKCPVCYFPLSFDNKCYVCQKRNERIMQKNLTEKRFHYSKKNKARRISTFKHFWKYPKKNNKETSRPKDKFAEVFMDKEIENYLRENEYKNLLGNS